MKPYKPFGLIMLYFLRFVPLFLGTVLLVSASLACSFWFFYSFLDAPASDQMAINFIGMQLPVLPAVAGCVGCGAQLFVYSFAANLSHVKDLLFKCILVVISTMTIGLSMFSTYSTLISYLESKSKTIAQEEFVTAQKQRIIESRNSDMNTNSLAAAQAISDKYRTQSKGLTESNEALRAQQLEELENLTNLESLAASPLDGLVRVVGDDALVSILFCAWLAITFDLLPILGISLVSRLSFDRTRQKGQELLSHGGTESRKANAVSIVVTERPPVSASRRAPMTHKHEAAKDHGEVDLFRTLNGNSKSQENGSSSDELSMVSLAKETDEVRPRASPSMDENTQRENGDRPNKAIQEILNKKPVYSDLPQEFQRTPIGDIPTNVLYPIITKYLSEGTIPLSYSGVGDFTGLSKWKIQQYFTKAVEEGFLVNKTRENEVAGYEFTKTVRYHIKRDIDLEAVLSGCQQW